MGMFWLSMGAKFFTGIRKNSEERYYFVVWCYTEGGQDSHILNTIIRGMHPVLWAANPPEIFDKFSMTYLLFWEEIPASIIEEVRRQKYFHIENCGYGGEKYADQ